MHLWCLLLVFKSGLPVFWPACYASYNSPVYFSLASFCRSWSYHLDSLHQIPLQPNWTILLACLYIAFRFRLVRNFWNINFGLSIVTGIQWTELREGCVWIVVELYCIISFVFLCKPPDWILICVGAASMFVHSWPVDIDRRSAVLWRVLVSKFQDWTEVQDKMCLGIYILAVKLLWRFWKMLN